MMTANENSPARDAGLWHQIRNPMQRKATH
ncbi:hypothetical protein NC652_002111 [Populus alba x Populus x berolinensis]|nr:hypothetical protein NC652_002111 [Populus alba x Populus x berolinensis]